MTTTKVTTTAAAAAKAVAAATTTTRKGLSCELQNSSPKTFWTAFAGEHFNLCYFYCRSLPSDLYMYMKYTCMRCSGYLLPHVVSMSIDISESWTIYHASPEQTCHHRHSQTSLHWFLLQPIVQLNIRRIFFCSF